MSTEVPAQAATAVPNAATTTSAASAKTTEAPASTTKTTTASTSHTNAQPHADPARATSTSAATATETARPRNAELNTSQGTEIYDWSRHTFVTPTKHITTAHDVTLFAKSRTHDQLMAFIRCLNDSVLMIPTTTTKCTVSPAAQAVLDLLDELSRWADEIEPLKEQCRFGNKAFRIWHEKLKQTAAALHRAFLPATLQNAVIELVPYFTESFGNETRIDYGTGHELAFLAWLYVLVATGFFGPADYRAIVLRVFIRYLDVVRKLQQRYKLEPAGSHGVWGLDDYQFLPFIWGAAQLVDHPNLDPGSVLSPALVSRNCQDYLYFACIKYITDHKKAPFHEHSPDLYNISATVSWRKVNVGMQRKYEIDVMTKFPVVQHFLFGSVLPWVS
ncbi:serine/threonine-protein phosphatase 2A regulatory subunit B' [Pelomyxa schiedti]|nr:serine/threonine-protein phosphatase 2A regulatory subunit B' [Pelomyxa schiedti]